MNVSELKAAGYEWIMHEMIRLKKQIDRLTAELAKQREIIEYAAAQDEQATKGTLALEADLKAKDAEIATIKELETKMTDACGRLQEELDGKNKLLANINAHPMGKNILIQALKG